MKRFKKPKKEKEKTFRVPNEYIMKVIMPCVMLACKDEFKVKNNDKLTKLSRRIQQNINFIASDMITQEQLHELMDIVDSTEATTYFDDITTDLRTK